MHEMIPSELSEARDSSAQSVHERHEAVLTASNMANRRF